MAIHWQVLDEATVEIPCKKYTVPVPVGTYRARVPNGWLVMVTLHGQPTVTFYPDPRHEWDGSTLEEQTLRAMGGRAIMAFDSMAAPVGV